MPNSPAMPNPAAKQGESEPAGSAAALLEQLGLNAICPREAPGGDGDVPREHGLQRAPRLAPSTDHRGRCERRAPAPR
jgi:hypothetical protein